MKKITTVISVILFLCLFASCFFCLAIGFDAEEVYESVFVVNTNEAIGSGFAVGTNSLITNAHVIEDAETIWIETYSGEEFDAYVYAVDYELDIALLIVTDAELIPLPKADTEAVKIGEDIYTIGAPKGLSYTLTTGAVSAKNREVDGYYYIQIDAPINTGNSGGPLLNDKGEVLGINTLKFKNSEGIGLAIPIDAAIEFLKSCDITFDEKGNINYILETPMIPYKPEDDNPQDFSDFENFIPNNPTNSPDTPPSQEIIPETPVIIENNRTGIYVLAVLFGISFLLNIGLIIYITKKRSKTVPFTEEPIDLYIDPSERTDFEIEFME